MAITHYVGGPNDGKSFVGQVMPGVRIGARLPQGRMAVYEVVGDVLLYVGTEDAPMGPLLAAIVQRSEDPHGD